MTKRIYNRHDHFFAQQLKDKTVAKAFFKSYLPEVLKKDIDFDSIEMEQLDAKLIRRLGLTNKIADILFKVQYKKESAFFLLHIEHQSTDDFFIPLRMTTYAVNILTNYLDANKKATKLPPIFGLVYYHGKTRPYPNSMKFVDLFGDLSDEEKEYLLNPILIDVSQYDDKALSQHAEMAQVDILMKHSFDQCTYDLLIHLLKVIRQASVQRQQECVDYIESNYDYSPEEFLALIKEYLSEVDFMTIRQRVEERAAQSALAAAAKNLLLKGLEPEFIAQNIGLSLEDVKKIKETIH